jgi:hypothetical protein
VPASEGGVPVLNHIQPTVTSSFSAARMRAAAPNAAVALTGVLMTVNDADTSKGSHSWSPPE